MSILSEFVRRLFTLAADFGDETFTDNDHFFWIPWIMPHVGGIIGAATYWGCISALHSNKDE